MTRSTTKTLTAEQIHGYCERFFVRSGNTGFPTLKKAAKRFRCSMQEILDLVDGHDSFTINVAIGINGTGIANLAKADWEIESMDSK